MKKSTLYLAVSMALPGFAFAGPPVGFGTDGSADGVWSLDTATQQIDHECPATMTCGTSPISDNNFLQVQMTDGSGATYFRTIIATDAAADSFTSESFVKSGTTNGGIAAQQTMNSDQTSTGAGVLQTSTTLSTGDFNAGEDQVVLSQDVWDKNTSPEFHSGFGFTKNAAGTASSTTLDQQIVVPGTTDGFADSFSFVQAKNLSTNTVTSAQLDIVSGVVLNDTGGSLNDQTFSYSYREGTPVAAGTAELDDSNGNPITVSWTDGQAVSRVLVGQDVTDAGTFGYESIDNITTVAADQITQFDLASVGPFSTITGSDPFGTPSDPTSITIPGIP
jgi:hypothetical protein